MSGSRFDFGLYLFHDAGRLLDRGSGPYFYLPKLEGHLDARLWNDVFTDFGGRRRALPGDDQGDGARGDDPRHLRDRRDPLRAPTIRPAPTPGVGTTSSASSRSSTTVRSSCFPTGTR